MTRIKKQHIARLEAQLEGLIENAFAGLFGSTIRAQDVALHLARAMDDHLLPAYGLNPHPIAPDHYTIHINPAVHRAMLKKYPTLATILADHLTNLASRAGYHMREQPIVKLLVDDTLPEARVIVTAGHQQDAHNGTDALEAVSKPAHPQAPNAQFIVNDQRVIPLTQPLINIGRQRDNDIILSDPAVSRYHAQIRLRYGEHLLFNAQSKAGTFVNGIRIREHILKSGDVVTLGNTQLIYHISEAEDDQEMDDTTGQILT